MDFLFGPIDVYMEKFAASIGQHPSGICLLFSYFLTFPLALGFRIKVNRHLYSIVSGGLLQLFLYREGCIHFLIMILITKMLMHVVDRKKQPWIIFIFCLTYSSACCIADYIFRYRSSQIVYSFFTNILCNRLSTLGFCYRDAMKAKDQLSEHREKCKIDKIPSLIELLSYCCYPGCCIIGPFFEYKDYINFIEEKEQYSSIPFSLVEGAMKYIKAVLFMAIAVVILQFIYIDFFGTENYNNSTLIMKLTYTWMIANQFKYKCYSVWFFADGANILSGLSYSGNDKDGKPQYETIRCIKYKECEFGDSPRETISAWNNQTGVWLRYYVYERVKKDKKENEEKASFITFMVSAFWHGFYPGYYIAFALGFMILSINRKVYACREYFSWMPDILKWLLSYTLFWFYIIQVAAFHINLQLDYALNVCKNTYFITIGSIVFAYALCWIVPTPRNVNKMTNGKIVNNKTNGKKHD